MAGKRQPPPYQAPQLATLVDQVPEGRGWLHEYKYDGYRLLIAIGGGRAVAWTRKGKDWSDKFRPLVDAAATLPDGTLLDGEAVALGADGKPSFQALQAGLKSGDADLAYYAFDLLIEHAAEVGANAVIGMRYDANEVTSGVTEVLAYGTAVVVEKVA